MKKGDKVTYLVSRKIGKGFSLSSKEGIFIKHLDDNHCWIKAKNGKMTTQQTKFVKQANQQDALTEAILKRPTPGDNKGKENI